MLATRRLRDTFPKIGPKNLALFRKKLKRKPLQTHGYTYGAILVWFCAHSSHVFDQIPVQIWTDRYKSVRQEQGIKEFFVTSSLIATTSDCNPYSLLMP